MSQLFGYLVFAALIFFLVKSTRHLGVRLEAEVPPPPEPEIVHRPGELVIFTESGGISVSAHGEKEVRLAIKILRLKRKELVAEKSVARMSESAELYAHNLRSKQRGRLVRGSGLISSAVRASQRSNRRSDLLATAASAGEAHVDAELLRAQIALLDSVIVQFQQKLLEHEARQMAEGSGDDIET